MGISELLTSRTGQADPFTGCMEWTGTRTVSGYGTFSLRDETLYAHRAAYECANGPIPEGVLIRHRCDNPPCVNPAHLLPGSDADNTRDKVTRGRHIYGEAVPAHKLTEEQVRDIRRRHAQGELKAHLAREYGVWQKTVTKIVRRETWKHLTD